MAIVTFKGDYDTFFKPNTPFATLIQEAVWRGTDVEKHGDDGQITVNDVSDIDIATYMTLVEAGLLVEGFPVFIKMSVTKYAQDVPFGIPNRSYQDVNGETVVRKWSEWKDDAHNHMDAADGDKIVPANSWGVELTGVETKIIYDAAGYTLLTRETLSGELPVDEE